MYSFGKMLKLPKGRVSDESCRENINRIKSNYYGMRAARDDDKLNIRKIMKYLRTHMRRNKINLIRARLDDINNRFIKWNEEEINGES